MVVIVAILAICTTVSAQSIWLPHSDKQTVSLEILKPDGHWSGVKLTSMVMFLSTRVPVSENCWVLVEVPFSHYDGTKQRFDHYPYYYWREINAQNLLGNPYVGLEIGDTLGKWYSKFGIRLPAAPDDKPYAAEYGLFADFDRAEAFSSDIIPVNCRFGLRHFWESGVSIHGYLGPTIEIYSGSRENVDTEVTMDYGLQI